MPSDTTWLIGEVEPTFGNSRGYTNWVRKDREDRVGGVAFCFIHGLLSQKMDVKLPLRNRGIIFLGGVK